MSVSTHRPAKAEKFFLVAYGKNGGFGLFCGPAALPAGRHTQVIVRTQRGLELGTVLCEATSRHRQTLHETVGAVVRTATEDDFIVGRAALAKADQLFEQACNLTSDLAVEMLDAEVLMDGKHAILHFLSPTDQDLTDLITALQDRFELKIQLENLAAVATADHDDETEGGCGKPGCGRSSGGECSSCGDGGCSSCGSSSVDMRDYFAHLRSKMEHHHRTPLA